MCIPLTDEKCVELGHLMIIMPLAQAVVQRLMMILPVHLAQTGDL